MLARWARFCGRWRYLVLAAWAGLLFVSVPMAGSVTHNLSGSGFEDPHSSSVWADTQLADLKGRGIPSLLIEGSDFPQVRSFAAAAGIPGKDVRRVAARQTLLVPVQPYTFAQAAKVRNAAMRAHATVRSVGETAVGQKVLTDLKSTLAASLPIALPLILILLLLVFGSVASAALPLIVAMVGSILALGAIDVLEDYVVLSSYLTDIVSLLALGVGVDYALFISSRFRQELRRGGDADRALGEAMHTAGRSVLYSGIAVALAVATLVIGGNPYWRGVALGGAVAVAAVLLATHTLLPALLRLFGRRIDWGRLPSFGRFGRIWPAIARSVGRRPAWAMLIGVLLLGAPAVFGLQLTIRTPANLATLLPRSDPLRKAADMQMQVLGAGELFPVVLAMRFPAGATDPATWQAVARIASKAAALPDVRSVESATGLGLTPAQLSQVIAHPALAPVGFAQRLTSFVNAADHPHVVLVYVTPGTGADAPATVQLVHTLQKDVSGWLPANTRSGVGGATALLDGFNRLTAARLPWVIGGVALIAFLILLLATGSLLQSLLGVVFDGLVALATAGILVLTVQRGGFGLGALAPDSSITPLVFVLLFGLSMDYEVILLHRVQEKWREGMASADAAASGLAGTGAMITGAGIIMVVVFVGLITSPLEIMQTLAIGMTSAILLDTWIVRTLLVPGSIALLGRLAFWPWGRRGATQDTLGQHLLECRVEPREDQDVEL